MCVSIPMITIVAITWYQSHFLTQLEQTTWEKVLYNQLGMNQVFTGIDALVDNEETLR